MNQWYISWLEITARQDQFYLYMLLITATAYGWWRWQLHCYPKLTTSLALAGVTIGTLANVWPG